MNLVLTQLKGMLEIYGLAMTFKHFDRHFLKMQRAKEAIYITSLNLIVHFKFHVKSIERLFCS